MEKKYYEIVLRMGYTSEDGEVEPLYSSDGFLIISDENSYKGFLTNSYISGQNSSVHLYYNDYIDMDTTTETVFNIEKIEYFCLNTKEIFLCNYSLKNTKDENFIGTLSFICSIEDPELIKYIEEEIKNYS